MSWPYLTAATRLRLPASPKIVALALGDRAGADGRVADASNRWLRIWTGQSKHTVQEALRELAKRTLLSVREEAVTATATAPVYQLHYPGAVVALPGAVGAPAVEILPGAKRALDLGQPLPLNDRSLILRTKAGQASRRTRLEIPTGPQMLKLVFSVLEDPDPSTRPEEEGDFREAVKYACSRAHFVYDPGMVTTAINQAFAARGLNTFSYEKGQRR